MPNQPNDLSTKLIAFRAFLRERLPEDHEKQMGLAHRIMPPARAYVRRSADHISVEEWRHQLEVYFFLEVLGLNPQAPAVTQWFAPKSLDPDVIQKACGAVQAGIDQGDKDWQHLFEDMFRSARRVWKDQTW